MKTKFIIGLVVLLVAGLTSCTLEKRHYRNGFYVSGLRSHEQPVKETENEVVVENPLASTADVTEERIAEPVQVITTAEETSTTRTKDIVPTAVQKESNTDHVAVENAAPSAPGLIVPDKKQAIGAGIAAAIFFFLGMAGLVIKGTAGPVGIFIGAAFVCFILCIILASFLYPKETQVKTPKEESTYTPKDKAIAGVGLGLLIVSLLAIVTIVYLFLEIFVGLFY